MSAVGCASVVRKRRVGRKNKLARDDEQRRTSPRVLNPKEGIHSGHFMVSDPHTLEDSEPGTEHASRDDADPIVDVMQDTILRIPQEPKPTSLVKTKTVDQSLAKLFECMSLAYRYDQNNYHLYCTHTQEQACNIDVY